MARSFLTNVDLGWYEVLKLRLQNLATAPANPQPGWAYFDTALNAVRVRNAANDGWIDLATASGGTVTSVTGAAPVTSTGGATPEIGITDATTAARGAMTAADKTKLDGIESGATGDQTASEILAALITVDGSGSGLDADTIDGVESAALERVANKNQANGYAGLDGSGKIASNQIPQIALTDVSVVADIAARNALTVEEGDVAIVTGTSQTFVYDGTTWQEMTSPTDGVQSVTAASPLGSSGGTAPEISLASEIPVAFGGTGATDAAGARANLGVPTKYAVDIGDGVATSYTVTHNLGTRDAMVKVYRTTSPWDEVMTDVEMTSTNSVTIRFAAAPTASQYRVVVMG